MAERIAEIQWEGGMRDGKGHVHLGSGMLDGAFSFMSRQGEALGMNPEELLGAASAQCFTMALASVLERAGSPATLLKTTATVGLAREGYNYRIPAVNLHLVGIVPGISATQFQTLAEEAKRNCPVGKALAGTSLNLTIHLQVSA